MSYRYKFTGTSGTRAVRYLLLLGASLSLEAVPLKMDGTTVRYVSSARMRYSSDRTSTNLNTVFRAWIHTDVIRFVTSTSTVSVVLPRTMVGNILSVVIWYEYRYEYTLAALRVPVRVDEGNIELETGNLLRLGSCLGVLVDGLVGDKLLVVCHRT
eukprot:scaffold541385_cov19-Prasinocladus_malaysianus.AAC.1